MTPAQTKWLENLVCERLASDENNDIFRLDFENKLVDSLVDFIAGPETMSEDARGDVAVYVIKDGETIIAFFTIRCGHIFESVIKKDDRRFYELFTAGHKLSDDEQRELLLYQAEHELTPEEMKLLADKIEHKIQSVKPKKNDEHNLKESSEVNLVHTTYPGIELVHFCKNENYSGPFETLFPRMRLGEVLFMAKIVPVLKKVREYIGCKYVYLFAAANERDSKLVAHYRENLGFNSDPGYGVNKALHESGCLFMAQTLDELFQRADDYTYTAVELKE